MLKLVRDAQQRGEAFMTTERAVHRLTGEIASWLGLDAGVLELDKRADLVVIDPAQLDAALDGVEYAAIAGFGEDYLRLVRRNDAAVHAVLINGIRVVENGVPMPALGREKAGRVLKRLA